MRFFRRVAILLLTAVVMSAANVPAQAQLFGRKNDDSSVRLDQTEERVRQLTGQIEQLTYQLRELQDQIRRMQEDNEYRFQQLEGGAPGGNLGDRTSNDIPMDDHGPSGTGTSPRSLGSLDGAGSGDSGWSASGGYETGADAGAAGAAGGGGPIDLGALAGGLGGALGGSGGDVLSLPQDPGTQATADSIAGLVNSGDPRSDYDKAYSLAVNGDYAAAADAFQSFMALYPEHELAGNAQFWLGESLLAQRDFREAADAFLEAYTNYPQSDKRSDSLLKLGMSLNGLGEGEAACATYSELLAKFPSAAPAVLQQARDERQRAKCS
ncbi:tol-pal system protein YbgF [Roseibium sp. CAU 1637]|uniref:Cell division coordinator CpoB n=1 Tax=Roseibium limicola TaxID=2816037 RepID=A0A939ESP9_9HYPH|nr:tol-pal system protein YbgF [Roseibium limicola]MBO0346908.1 tol-pal system protein YbgF [Roseibium limicola]